MKDECEYKDFIEHAQGKSKSSTRRRNAELKYKFGISIEKYDGLMKKQNKKCAICGIQRHKYKENFSVDHDHETGKIRGLLCKKCNSILGFAGDSSVMLLKAYNYLRKKQ